MSTASCTFWPVAFPEQYQKNIKFRIRENTAAARAHHDLGSIRIEFESCVAKFRLAWISNFNREPSATASIVAAFFLFLFFTLRSSSLEPCEIQCSCSSAHIAGVDSGSQTACHEISSCSSHASIQDRFRIEFESCMHG